MDSGGREGRRWWLLGRRGDVVTVALELKIYSKFVSNSESNDFICHSFSELNDYLHTRRY
jgi:hypothetical protein